MLLFHQKDLSIHIKRPRPFQPSLACTLSEAVSLDGKLFFIRIKLASKAVRWMASSFN